METSSTLTDCHAHESDPSSPSLAATQYLLVTAAYNEADHIERTIESVIAQTIRPACWVVVSDGSTDGTDDVIKRYARENSFICFLRVEKSDEHCFAAKVRALHHGFAELAGKEYEFIGILDADISFEANYFETLLSRFADNPKIGICGGNIVQDVDGTLEPRVKDMNTVAGAVQFFRKACFEQTEGFPPLKFGGEDAAIETRARMKDWEVRTFPDLQVIHYGIVGEQAGSRLRARFKWGRMNYSLGYHPLYQIARCAYRSIERPYLLGSLAEVMGFCFQGLSEREPEVDAELVRFLRREQLAKLRSGLFLRRSH